MLARRPAPRPLVSAIEAGIANAEPRPAAGSPSSRRSSPSGTPICVGSPTASWRLTAPLRAARALIAATAGGRPLAWPS